MLLDSSSISSEGWTEIALCLQSNYHLYDGFVILHGTDSLSYTASALSFMISHLGKTVVMTGSQSPIFALQSDAVDNLLGSLIIAGTFLIPEVTLFFHHTLYRGNRTTKISASSFEAFASPNIQPLAQVTGMGIIVNWALVRRPTSINRFAVQYSLDTTHVACLRVFPGITPHLVDSVLHTPGLRGLILETFGAGNAPSDTHLTKVIKEAIVRGVVIVNVSQCPAGTVSPLYAPAKSLGLAGVVYGHDLTTEAALTKLFCLLAQAPVLDYQEIVANMSKDLRGEMTELPSATQFAHIAAPEAGTSLSDKQKSFTELAYATSAGDYQPVCAMLDADTHGLLFEADYAGNTALHLAAVGRNEDIVSELLNRGASVHARNFANNTPLWLAQKMEKWGNVEVLRKAGGMLHVEEMWTENRIGLRVLEEGKSGATTPEKGHRKSDRSLKAEGKPFDDTKA